MSASEASAFGVKAISGMPGPCTKTCGSGLRKWKPDIRYVEGSSGAVKAWCVGSVRIGGFQVCNTKLCPKVSSGPCQRLHKGGQGGQKRNSGELYFDDSKSDLLQRLGATREWAPWSACSRSCGTAATQMRKASLVLWKHGIRQHVCVSPTAQRRKCNLQPCAAQRAARAPTAAPLTTTVPSLLSMAATRKPAHALAKKTTVVSISLSSAPTPVPSPHPTPFYPTSSPTFPPTLMPSPGPTPKPTTIAPSRQPTPKPTQPCPAWTKANFLIITHSPLL